MSASLRLCEYMVSTLSSQKKAPLQQKNILFANIGFSSTSIFLFNTNTLLPLQNHIIPFGLDLFIKEIKTNKQINENQIRELLQTTGFDDTSSLKLSETLNPGYQEFSTEIIRYLQSLKEKNTIIPNQLILFGNGSRIKGLSNKLQTSIGIQTEVINIILYMKPNPIVDYFKNDWSSFISVIGACL